MNDADLLTIARIACTDKQLAALELKAAGLGARLIGRALGISPQAAQARLEGAYRRISQAKDTAA